MADADDVRGPTRRRVLAGLATAVGVGAVGGAGTRAFLRDTETVPGDLVGNPYDGGRLELALTCGDGAACRSGDGSVTFEFADIAPPASGRTELCLGVRETPAWVWLRTSPPVDASLGDVLAVTLAYSDGRAVVPTAGATVPLNDLLATFEAGGRLRGTGRRGAFAPGGDRCLELAWWLPAGVGVDGQSVALTLEFAAVQYRADATPQNPWERYR